MASLNEFGHYSDCFCYACGERAASWKRWTDIDVTYEAEMEKLRSKKSESQQRKETPLFSGTMMYFPLALLAVARLCFKSNEKHNPGEPLHWSREKSADHMDCVARHSLEVGKVDPETDELFDVHVAWRALANLQLAEEKRLGITKETK